MIWKKLTIGFADYAQILTSLLKKDVVSAIVPRDLGIAQDSTGGGDECHNNSDGWICCKCSNSNLPSKKRCSVCRAWKGGKRRSTKTT